VKQCVTSFIKLAQPGYMERSHSKNATHSRRSLESYCHKLPFCRGKIAFGHKKRSNRTSPAKPTLGLSISFILYPILYCISLAVMDRRSTSRDAGA